MTHDEITATLLFRLVREGTDPTEPAFAITLRDVISTLVRRLGEESLKLSSSELLTAQDEIRAVFEHNYHEKELVDTAIKTWEIRRALKPTATTKGDST